MGWTVRQVWNFYCMALRAFYLLGYTERHEKYFREGDGQNKSVVSEFRTGGVSSKGTFRVTAVDWHTEHTHRKSEFMSSYVHM